MFFRQLFEAESSTYTYLLADEKTREAVIIDPVKETLARDLKLIEELALRLVYVLDTHVHADHITSAGELRRVTKATTAVAASAGVSCVDRPLKDGDEISFGSHKLKVISTPGHTDSCLSFWIDDRVFTGDALLIRGTGRTDFQQGSSSRLYHSLTQKLFTLPDETLVYPAHDYQGRTVSTIGEEKRFNPRVGGGKSEQEFSQIMAELKLANPKKIHEAVPANLGCGRSLLGVNVDGVPTVEVLQVAHHSQGARLIDVRQPHEFNGELGHIPGAELVTLETELSQALSRWEKSEELIFICRSGVRSAQATRLALAAGFRFAVNMRGGMLAWNEQGQKVERV